MTTPTNPLHTQLAPIAPLAVLSEVAAFPNGATASEVAARTGQPVGATWGALLDLAGSGVLDRNVHAATQDTPAGTRFTLTPEGRALVLASTGQMRAIVVSDRS